MKRRGRKKRVAQKSPYSSFSFNVKRGINRILKEVGKSKERKEDVKDFEN